MNSFKSMLKGTFLIALVLCPLSFPSFASLQQEADSRSGKFSFDAPPAMAAELGQQEVIDIDGRLDEAYWQKAPVLSDFTQQNPDDGQPATEKTEVRILYSRDSLYVGVRAFDAESRKIKAIMARRDSDCPSDWIKIWIDSYHDRLTAYEFSINPSGVKRDVHWSNDATEDVDWDVVWNVKVSQDSQGWTAEFMIPFSQIRFPERPSHIWGFQACREIARKKEISYWRPVPKGSPRFVSLFGDLSGIQGIPSPKRIHLIPHILGKGSFLAAERANPLRPGPSYLSGFGLDLKYGLSSNLTLDATFNPDFGQVEADPAEFNLTAHEIYFSEKRLFFIEGKDMLAFPLEIGRSTQESLFYSRRIGRLPQGSPSSGELIEMPDSTTILGAFKLTGKTAQGWSVGIIEALTGKERADIMKEPGGKAKETVEPLTNYFVGRAKKEFRNGRSNIGLIFTSVNRKIEDESLDFLCRAAYSGGVDFRHRWAKDTYEVTGFFIGSHIRGSEEAILKVQEAPPHYFQRSDAPHIEVDPTRTSLSGIASCFAWNKIGGGHWRWSIAGLARSPGFEVNDVGYMRFADWINQNTQVRYEEYKPGKIFREYKISFTLRNSWDFLPKHTEQRASLQLNLTFLNYWNTDLTLSRGFESRQIDYLRGGPSVLTPGSWSLRESFKTDPRKELLLNWSGNINFSDDGAKSYGMSSSLTLRTSDRLQLYLQPGFDSTCNFLQYVSTRKTPNRSDVILGRIDRKTVSLTFRTDYALTPELSLQLYCQPYISAGTYGDFKSVVQPLAKNYHDRWHVFMGQEIVLKNGEYHVLIPGTEQKEFIFKNPDFNFKQFRLNFVLRWEYQPGSLLFLVWSNGINERSPHGSLSLGQDLQNLFRTPSDNVFLIKISHWFNLWA